MDANIAMCSHTRIHFYIGRPGSKARFEPAAWLPFFRFLRRSNAFCNRWYYSFEYNDG